MRIKKVVGKPKQESPLQRAFRMSKMLKSLRGDRSEDSENVRKIVGRTQEKKS